MTDACAGIVRRDDPHLYQTALFAPEPARSRLMVLYAFDCELSRASQASNESLIPRMRLQWWRDVVAEAAEGAAPKAHEVAGPLAGLLRDGLNGDVLARLIDAHGMMLDTPWSEADWDAWRSCRFPSLLRAATVILVDGRDRGRHVPGEDPGQPGGGIATEAVAAVGATLADAFALRHAARMAAEGRQPLLPVSEPGELSALARGALSDRMRADLRKVAEASLSVLQAARGTTAADKVVIPALFPVLWAERTLRLVARDPAAVLGQLDDVDRPFDGLRLAWRAATGRW